jgi:hypothetical protein
MSTALRRRIELLEQREATDSLPPETTEARQFVNDPLWFVMWVFPWGQRGTSIEKEIGPDEWAEDISPGPCEPP